MDWKLELVVVPVSDVDRAKAFYADQLGFSVVLDHRPNESFRRRAAHPTRFGVLDHDRHRRLAGRAGGRTRASISS